MTFVTRHGQRYFGQAFVIFKGERRSEHTAVCNLDHANPEARLVEKAKQHCETHGYAFKGRVWSTDDWKAHYAEKARKASVRATESRGDVPTPFG